MANVIIFNPTGIVSNMVTNYLISVNTPDYENNPDALINPDVSALQQIAQKYWKVDNANVIEMNSTEKTTIDENLKAKTNRVKNFKIDKYSSSNLLIKETWYDTDNDDGTYSGKAEETNFTYQNNSSILLYKIVDTFYYDTTIKSSIKYMYYLNNNNEIIEKKVEV